ncbi:MAG: GGDEF domain-containing protein [Bacilli bacterium]|nr:GGDEF domain-containing protein [Bacilli bacterium]
MYENLSRYELMHLIKIKDDKINLLEEKICCLTRSRDIDSLTGLYNRNVVNEAYINSSSIIMCDVDNFKEINDFYGHNGGDLVLKQISIILKDCVRSSDYVLRWGGEEFLIFVNCDLNDAYNLAERIRRKVKNISISYGETYISNISMSFGVSFVSSSFISDIESADRALYKSKTNGKDQVNVFKL